MKKKVLLIEDDKTLLENTRDLLEFAHYDVLTAQNGKIGVQMAREKLPDIIVSDIMMPELNGYQVFEALKEDPATERIPFIFISVKRDQTDIRKGMNLGADDYITKPFKEDDLLTSIESRLAKSQILRERNGNKVNHSEKSILNLDQLRSYFRNYGEYIEVEKNEEIYREGRHASYIYLVEEGLIKIFRLDEYGKELITWLSKKDDILGFYSFKIPTQYPETAEALETTKLFRISSEEFIHTLLKSQELTVEFAQLISENLSILKTHLLEMAYGSVLKKTTNTILEFAEKIQSDPEEFIRISRSDLASVAGISTESFIRSLSCLKKEGLIDIIGRDIKILNLQKLHSIR
ncbi:response regulator [Salinimicrobium gaetbulicola]|uniref:Response regulator n=1 Tax=Salinimicrobium gaetbulicola TaxID=999702 RepID=A0ABW3IHD1_9FLAO